MSYEEVDLKNRRHTSLCYLVEGLVAVPAVASKILTHFQEITDDEYLLRAASTLERVFLKNGDKLSVSLLEMARDSLAVSVKELDTVLAGVLKSAISARHPSR